MISITGALWARLTFPGVIVHEFAHKIFCNLSGVKVYEVKYFSIRNGEAGHVLHEQPKTFENVFWISVGPIVVNTILAIAFTYTARIYFGSFYDIRFIIMIWLALSVGIHALPSNTDARNILDFSKSEILHHFKIWHIFTFPFFWTIQILNFLKIFWIDLLFAILLVYIGLNINF